MAAQDERARLRAVFDRLVPDDGWPSLSESGLWPYLEGLAADPLTRPDLDAIVVAVARLGPDVADLAPDALDARLATAGADLELLASAAARAHYGDALGAGARMVGYRRHPGRGPAAPVVEPVLRTTAFADLDDGYDVVVLGAGAGGGTAAGVLAEAGARVLLVERGGALGVGEVGRDHLRNHRSGAHGFGTGQPAEPRIVDGSPVERPWDTRWHAGAGLVGGGTRLFQGMAWRFLPDDLRMASRYGVPDGSSLADWPLTHDDLAPHWEWAEWEVGVAGDPSGHPAAGPRRRATVIANLVRPRAADSLPVRADRDQPGVGARRSTRGRCARSRPVGCRPATDFGRAARGMYPRRARRRSSAVTGACPGPL